MKKYLTSVFLFAAVIFITSCHNNGQNNSDSVKIAITKANDYYTSWIERNGNNTTWVNLYGLRYDSAMNLLRKCDGLLVTGGKDVFPGLYGKLADTARCEGFDRYRDSLELAAIQMAIIKRIPIFGICRGLQIINVDLGGTLIVDIPTDFDTIVKHRKKGGGVCYHEVTIVPDSRLSQISGVLSDTVNSAHHQGIEHLGRELAIVAYANDSLPEAIEWAHRGNKGFLMATQWHPEHMDPNHPLSKNPAVDFLNEAFDYHDRHHH